MKKSAKLSSTAYQKSSMDILLRVFQFRTKFILEIHAWGRSLRCPMDITAHDLQEMNQQLQQAMYFTARNTDQSPPNQITLENLAEVGHYAFRRLFFHSDAFDAITTLTNSNSNLTIQVATEDFFLPWELIYPFSPCNPSYECFWGMNHVISRTITQCNYSGAFVSPKISINSIPKLGVITYGGLEGVIQEEIPYFRSLEGSQQIQLFILQPLDKSRRRDEIQKFKGFLKNEFDIAHLACHASYDLNSPNQSYILISEEFLITLRDMDSYEMVVNGNPLVIINACDTGNVNTLYTSNFAAAFLRYGARGVIATECAVPDNFASCFSQRLYADLLTGETLGDSILATRQYFWENHENPSGLLYSMYAHPSIQLVQGKGSNE